MNWDSEYFYDIIYGNGFTITEPAEVAIDETKEKALYGAQSPLYGTSYSESHAGRGANPSPAPQGPSATSTREYP